MEYILKRIFIALVAVILTSSADAAANPASKIRAASTVDVRGRIRREGATVMDTLQVYYVADSLEDERQFNVLKVVTNKRGEFHFQIHADYLVKWKIWDRSAGCSFISIDPFLGAPGDRVFMEALVNSKHGFVVKVALKGRGSAKYQCIQRLEDVHVPLIRSRSAQAQIFAFDSVLALKNEILNSFKNSIGGDIYGILRADVMGTTGCWVIDALFPDAWNDNAPVKIRMNERFLGFDSILSHLQVGFHPSSRYAGLSTDYASYVYRFEKYRVAINDTSYIWNDALLLDEILTNETRGLMRDRVLIEFLQEHFRHAEFSKETTALYLKKVLGAVMSSGARKEIETLYNLTDREKACTFSLPRDSSGRNVSLSMFKGKVVLLDMWGNYCSSCVKFSSAFHEEIFPKFRNDTNFVVISIMMANRGEEDTYLNILRMRNAAGRPVRYKYTYPDYVNLFAAEDDRQRMVKFYKQDSSPLIVLVDKKGRVVATTQTGFPFFTTGDSPNVEKLTTLIRSELAN